MEDWKQKLREKFEIETDAVYLSGSIKDLEAFIEELINEVRRETIDDLRRYAFKIEAINKYKTDDNELLVVGLDSKRLPEGESNWFMVVPVKDYDNFTSKSNTNEQRRS